MKLHLATPADFSFIECVNAHGWKSLLPFFWDADTCVLSRVEDFGADGVALMHVMMNDGMVLIETDAAVNESDLTCRVQRMLQLDVSVADFHRYCEKTARLEHIPTLKQGRLLRSPSLFEDVVKVIATTNTTWAQTKLMVSRIVFSFGLQLPSDPLRRSFPTPQRIADVSVDEFAEKARMGYRNSSVHRIASAIANGELDLESWIDEGISSADLCKRLLSLPGIGPYAASCLMIYMGRYDRVNVDSWARTLVGKEFGRKVTDKEVHQFFESHGEWKALVYHFYQWADP